MTELAKLLATYRASAMSEREKGTYFEELILAYLRNEATYQDLYAKVWTWAEWAPANGFTAKDDGIDLVAEVAGTGEIHAIQCKFYDPDYKLQKRDIDSFFTASGRKPFTHRIIVSTTDHWSEHAENALVDQQPPVSKITLHDLAESQVDWAKYQPKTKVSLKLKKTLMAHQQTALNAVTAGLQDADRGKLIMACGTGKTFTSLKIAEAMAGAGKRVLFLVPSLSLLSQSLTEWTQESAVPLHSFAVCSDSDVGKKRGRKEDDAVQTLAHELRFPATTDAKALAKSVGVRHDGTHMTVVFSTYHSIEVIHDAQHDHGLDEFDLIVCDEAHRTTGATFEDQDESAFVRVHDAGYIRARKRLYMTATPRIYADTAKAMAERDNVALYSMDNEAWYGKQLFVITFSEAVKRGLLVDYKVIVLAVEESHINRRLQKLLKDENNTLKVDDAAKIVGCWKALAKLGMYEDGSDTPEPMKRAVAFCQVIEPGKGGKIHKVSSKEVAGMFQAVVEAYQDAEDIEDGARLTCQAEHVDGGMNAGEKEAKLDWLKAPTPPDTCRVLSNVRCLSEGVDVPALDAVLFLTPRNSQVDVVQSVGRVMRNAPGKKRGYVVLPVVIPAGVEPHEALNDNQTYKVVWQVLQALRSHDDRFDAMVNKLELVGPDPRRMEVVAIADNVQRKTARLVDPGARKAAKAKGKYAIGEPGADYPAEVQGQLEFEVGEIERALYAKVVEKCGNRHHWEDWANDIAKIAQTHIDRIKGVLEDETQPNARRAFDAFAAELRDDLNDKVSDAEIIEMLAQHLITKPVFDALFADYSFASHNPMSQAMQQVLDVLHEQRLEKETETLQAFYDSVKLRAEGIDSAAGKQKLIKELYDKFFNNAFPGLAKRLGIVYTPIEVVDFIIHSVNYILKTEFGKSLGSEGVHILDPFTGTGTFITRLMQSGLLNSEELKRKYKNEIHANEIVLLAYYIAAINVEATYHSIVNEGYTPFGGILLTDTFQMYEKDDLVDVLLADNSARRKRQRALDIRVIVGNPPYAEGQDSATEVKNVDYPALDNAIMSTYGAASSAKTRTNIYNSYIRAIRWASERINDCGVVAFCTSASYLTATATDGVRKCLAEEFSDLYIFNLRGDARTSGELRRKEKDHVFGVGSREPIAISVLVKNPKAQGQGRIFYRDIGDYLSQAEKLRIIEELGGIAGISDSNGWQKIEPDKHGDWLRQRDDSFEDFILIGSKGNGEAQAIFNLYSDGAITNRDDWIYNASRSTLVDNVKSMIRYFDVERERYKSSGGDTDPARFVRGDETKIKWDDKLLGHIKRDRKLTFRDECLVPVVYRPFSKQWMYFDKTCIWSAYQMPRIFPAGSGSKNLAICTSGVGAKKDFFALMVDSIIDRGMNSAGKAFPLYAMEANDHEANEGDAPGLFAGGKVTVLDTITDAGARHFTSAYVGENIGKEDVFYYIYGLFHSQDYRERYADNLSKELPRIPRVRTAKDFWHFSKAGRTLADLHLNYETVERYPLTIDSKGKLTDADYRVEQMKFAKKKDPGTGKSVNDRSIVIYNNKITLSGIPEAAWNYVVNGKAALDWVMERQAVRVDKASGIVNDANDWAIETMGNPKYPLELFQRVVTVSLETQKIVNALPRLEIREDG